MTTQRLRAVVTLGGAVDGSLGSMTREFEQNTRRMNREVGSLSRQQERLAARIKKAVLAGKDTSQLTREYQRLSVRIKNAADEAQRLSDLSERGARANQRLSDSFRQSAYAAGGLGAATAGFSALMTMANRSTAEMEGIAAGYDMSVETYALWDGIAKRMGDGFDGTKIGDLMEELSNKFGEFKNLGEESAFDEVAKALSLDTDKMKGMETYDQYLYVMDKLSKVSDKQQAATLADKLFGGDGNRVLTWLKNSGMSIDELLKRQKKMNLLTDEGRAGAKKYNEAFVSVTSTFGSAWREVSGIVGGEIAPQMEKMASDFAAWFSNSTNKQELVVSLKKFGTALKDVGVAIVNVAVFTNNLVETVFGDWGNATYALAAALGGKLVFSIGSAVAAMWKMGASFKATAVGARLLGTAFLGIPIIGWITGISMAAYAVWENWEWISDKLTKVWKYLSDKWNSLFGDSDVSVEHNVKNSNSGVGAFDIPLDDAVANKINSVAPASGNVTQNVGDIIVNSAPGQSAMEIAQAVKQAINPQKFHDLAKVF